jgi:O-antigen/teichoic acid export membrane protein
MALHPGDLGDELHTPEAPLAPAPPPKPSPTSDDAQSADRKVWHNVIGLVGGNVIGEALGVVVQAQLLHILGPGGFGRYAQTIAVVDVADGVGGFGMNDVGPVLAVQHGQREGLGPYLGTLLALRLVAVALVVAFIWFARGWLASSSGGLIGLALLALPFSALGNTATVPFFVHQENIRVAWVPGASAVLQMVALLCVLWWSPALPWVLLVMVLGKAFSAVIVSESARRRYRFRYGLNADVLRHLLRVGPRAAWLSSVVILYSRASYFVLDSLGPVMLGLYGLADRIASPMLRVTGALSASSLPMFAQLGRAGDRAQVLGFYLRNARRISWGLLALSPVIYGLVPWLIRVFFPKYVDAVPILSMLFVCVSVMSYCQLTTSCLNGLGYFGWVAIVATINLGVYALGAWMWVADYQALGAAMATGLMESCNLCMQLFLFFKVLRRLTPPQGPHAPPPAPSPSPADPSAPLPSPADPSSSLAL